MAAKCCPPGGSVYIDSSGFYLNPCTGTLMQVLTWTDGPVTGTYNMCGVTQCAPAAYGPVLDPIDCPCCPTGYSYMGGGYCCPDHLPTCTLKESVPVIPCPVCPPCPVPPTPVPCVGCETNQGLPKSFTFNPYGKNCVDCVVQGEPKPMGTGADRFIPIKLLDPIINFIFRT